jgi:outer membrane receptor protein involved in Fe transport
MGTIMKSIYVKDLNMKLSHTLLKKLLWIGITLIFIIPVYAADLEEVIVTATKREEGLQDIPQSISVVTGIAISEMSIVDFSELSENIPGFIVGDGIVTTSVNMRGMGSGGDRSFEQSVGMFIDGIYMPRSRQYRSPFFDVERVEVLRGPQAVLFGLNSTAGAVNVVSAKSRPGDAFFADVTAEYEMEIGGVTGSVVIGGSATETLGLRLAVKYLDMDGYYTNDFDGSEENSRKGTLARLTGVWNPTDNLSITAKFEYSDYDMSGNSGEVYGAILEGLVENKLDWRRNADAGLLGKYEPGWDPKAGLFQENTNIAVNLDYEFDNGHTFTALYGYSDMYFEFATDLDTTPHSAIFAGGTADGWILDIPSLDSSIVPEEYTQHSLELRVSSPLSEKFDYVFGVYFQDAELFNDNASGTNFTGLFPWMRFRSSTFDLDQNLWSVFATGTWHVDDRTRIIAGARYVDESKRVDRDGRCNYWDLATGDLVTPCAPPPLSGASGKRSSSNVMPELILQRDVNDDLMVYGKIGTSAKSGGFATATNVDPATWEYDEEKVVTYELGLKWAFLDGAAVINATIFLSDYEDLQVNAFVTVTRPDGSEDTLAAIQNAAESTNQGLEIDGRWAVNDWLMLSGSVAWLDAEYKKFDSASCPNFFEETVCDFSGKTLPYSPDFSSSLTADVFSPITETLSFVGGLTWSYSTEYFTDGTLDPFAIQDSYSKLSGRIGIAATDGQWSLTLIGKNLTDEAILDVTQPLFGYYLGYTNMPRTVTLQGTYHFGN